MGRVFKDDHWNFRIHGCFLRMFSWQIPLSENQHGICINYKIVEYAILQTDQRNKSVSPVSATFSVASKHPGLMHANVLFPDNARFNERRSDAILHAVVAIIGDILSCLDKKTTNTYTCTQPRAHAHSVLNWLWTCVSMIIEPFRSKFSKRKSKHVNPYSNTTKTHSLF